MQILFNELSLTGQFSDQHTFIRNSLLPFVGVLKEMQGFSTLLLKKSDVWDKMITPTSTLYSLLVDNALRTFDEVRRLKSAIVGLTKEPFWDSNSKQNPDSTYLLDGVDIRGSSPAEACERDKIVVSFVSSSASADPKEAAVELAGYADQYVEIIFVPFYTEEKKSLLPCETLRPGQGC